MANKKHYIIVSITLGIIAASSGALIGLTNLITKDKIDQNEKNKINAGIKEIFGENASVTSDEKLDGYDYANLVYYVEDNSTQSGGFAIRSSGSNPYGKITLILGFNRDSHAFIGLYTVVNEQTYAQTLLDNYLIPVDDGTRDVIDVKCGATYGATLVRDMINEATLVVEKL